MTTPARPAFDADVIVVGAGIAGALVAEALAKSGTKVTIGVVAGNAGFAAFGCAERWIR